jgi:hypothetical protein
VKSGRCGESDLGPTRYGPGRYDGFPQLVGRVARADAPQRIDRAGYTVRAWRYTRQECLDHDPNLSDREPSVTANAEPAWLK